MKKFAPHKKLTKFIKHTLDGVQLYTTKKGNIPGNMVFTGSRKVESASVNYVGYNMDIIVNENYRVELIDDIPATTEDLNQWYRIIGLHELDLIKKFGDRYRIHPLVLEDIVDVNQRPKFEEYEDGIYFVLNTIDYDEEYDRVDIEVVSIYFGSEYILSFQESDQAIFSEVKSRITQKKGRIVSRGVDYLAYALIDSIIDKYFIVLEQFEDDIEDLELEIMSDPNDSTKQKFHHYKSELIKIKKSIHPLLEAIDRFTESKHALVNKNTKLFLRDAHDHVRQNLEKIEITKEKITALQELHNSEVSYKMNKAMQFLAVVTTIFVPLSFLTGIYGMNFEHMPELHYKYGFRILLAFMAIIIISLIIYFKRKKWL